MTNVSILGNKIKVDIQTRFSDFDMLQHLNNANYLSYLEIARLEAFTKVFDVDVSKYTGVVADVNIQYRKPIKVGTPVSILLSISDVTNKSKTIHFEFVHAEDTSKVYATAKMTQVIFDIQQQKPTQIPDALHSAFNKLWNNETNQTIMDCLNFKENQKENA